MVDSEIMECPVCGNWRHKSMFNVGRRGCSICQIEGREYVVGFDRLQQRLDEQERSILKAIIFDLMTADELPAELTGTEVRIMQGRMLGYDTDQIAQQLGLKVNRMTSIEHTAQAKLTRLAKDLLPDWIATYN